ncbi:hypothetical protein C7T94_04650 [Pedobacter yulinensis]|uniref:Uncharacterized protein n=2 Tax=Pedobacter yulinensis TaxID=2126353 RepID=A0A2T3HNR3_9SPHI|nr:hypothetical protein C7T94_04650 [Pedobacter yulinensis]
MPSGPARATARHPLHVSTTEITANAREKNMEVLVRLFTDDFESILARKYRTKTDLSSPAMHKQMDELVRKYIAANLRLTADGKAITLNYVGFETDHEAVIAYFEVPGFAVLKKLETQNSLLYDLFDDQLNIVHVVSGGARKSSKLLFPEKQLVTIF